MTEYCAAIFMGAAEFPGHPEFSNRAFWRSKNDLEDYLRREFPKGLGVKSEAVLDLFGSRYSATDQVREIAQFLDRILAEISETGVDRNLLVYYVGHGYFGANRKDYYLALKSYDPEQREATGFKVSAFADNAIRGRSKSFRIFFILDCCFAGEAIRELMGDAAAVARVAAEALGDARPPIENKAPKRGSALLCAASKDDVALAPRNSDRTVFSDALLNVLKTGDTDFGQRLTFSNLNDMIWQHITKSNQQDYQVRPEVHSPDQSDGDVSSYVALFPNPGSARQSTIPGADGLPGAPNAMQKWNFTSLLRELRIQLYADGVFNLDWAHGQTHPAAHRDEELAGEEYLFRLFIQKLIFTASKIAPQSVGSANAWVCHKTREVEGRAKLPRYLRSGEREGHFKINQLVTKGAEVVRYRTNEVKYEEDDFDGLSVAAQSIVKGAIVFVTVDKTEYESEAERNIGITHILGIPLYLPGDLKGDMEGVPMAITVDFDFGKQVLGAIPPEMADNSRQLIEIFSKFKKMWEGTKCLMKVR